MCVRCSFGTCMESQVYGFESTCPLSNVSNKIEGGDLHLWRYWAALQECCLAPKESKHWWAWFWGEKKKKLLWFHWDLSIKRIPYLTLALHTTVHLGSVCLERTEEAEPSHDPFSCCSRASPPAPKLLLLFQKALLQQEKQIWLSSQRMLPLSPWLFQQIRAPDFEGWGSAWLSQLREIPSSSQSGEKTFGNSELGYFK